MKRAHALTTETRKFSSEGYIFEDDLFILIFPKIYLIKINSMQYSF